MYFQSSAMIPTRLYQTMYECLMKLLILPPPYSAVALRTLRSIKMEMITPGIMMSQYTVSERHN